MAEYIDREVAINEAEKYGLSDGSVIGRHSGIADCIASEISKIPAADVAPVRRGHWIKCGYACGEAEFKCSLCGEIEWRTNETDYCPNCGAKIKQPKVWLWILLGVVVVGGIIKIIIFF